MTLRKFLLFSVPAIFLLIAAIFSFKMWTTLKKNEKQKSIYQQLPSLTLRKIDGTELNTLSLKYSKDLLILNYFNPDCDHCQSMVRELFQEQSKIINVKWLMITSASVEKTKRFSDSMNISQLQSVTVLIDTASIFTQTFEITSVPSFYVYKNGELLRKHSGECSVAYLVQE